MNPIEPVYLCPAPPPPASSLSNSPERRGYSFVLLSSKFIIQIRELARTRSAVSPRYPKFIDTIGYHRGICENCRFSTALYRNSPMLRRIFLFRGLESFFFPFASETDFDRRSTDSRAVGPARERGQSGRRASATFRGALRY